MKAARSTRKMSVSGSRRSTRIAPNRQNRIKNSRMTSRKWKMYDYIQMLIKRHENTDDK